MVRLPFIKIPSVRVGGIDPTSDTSLAYGGGEAEEPTPIEYLTAWRLVGNSSVEGDEIWSCGELGQDTKYHIYVSSNGKTFDIALTEPLRKVGSVADTIEFADNVATVTRYLASDDLGDLDIVQANTNTTDVKRYKASSVQGISTAATSKVLTAIYNISPNTYGCVEGINAGNGVVYIYDANYNQVGDRTAFINHITGSEILYELETPTTETIEVPQIEVSSTDTYTQVISQGAKAVEWTSFTPNPEPEEEEE